MKISVLCTSQGLVPIDDESYEEKKKLKVGATYECEIKVKRNYKFHKKYFALINCSWEYLPESQTKGFGTKEIFRKWVEIQAGHCEILKTRKETYKLPKSVSFDAMDEAAFSDLYERVKDIIWNLINRYVSEDEFERNLANF